MHPHLRPCGHHQGCTRRGGGASPNSAAAPAQTSLSQPHRGCVVRQAALPQVRESSHAVCARQGPHADPSAEPCLELVMAPLRAPLALPPPPLTGNPPRDLGVWDRCQGSCSGAAPWRALDEGSHPSPCTQHVVAAGAPTSRGPGPQLPPVQNGPWPKGPGV